MYKQLGFFVLLFLAKETVSDQLPKLVQVITKNQARIPGNIRVLNLIFLENSLKLLRKES